MPEPDFRKMGDPLNDRLPPKDNLLNRRRGKDLARIVGPRTLDDENVCTRCGVPDVHCHCEAFRCALDDFPPATHLTLPQWERHKAMLEEIDRLRRRDDLWAASVRWHSAWVSRSVSLLCELRNDLDHELTESGHLAELEQLLSDEFEDGEDDES